MGTWAHQSNADVDAVLAGSIPRAHLVLIMTDQKKEIAELGRAMPIGYRTCLKPENVPLGWRIIPFPDDYWGDIPSESRNSFLAEGYVLTEKYE